jgi:hypothetical protein
VIEFSMLVKVVLSVSGVFVKLRSWKLCQVPKEHRCRTCVLCTSLLEGAWTVEQGCWEMEGMEEVLFT